MTGGFRRVTPGGNGGRQSIGGMIDAGKLRMKFVEQEIVTFKVTSKNGAKFDKAVEFSFGPDGHDVTLLEVEGDIAPEQRRFTTPGIGGAAGAGMYVRVSKADAQKITSGGWELAGTRSWREELDDQDGGRVELGVQWDPCDGLRTMALGAIWGFDGNKTLDETGGYFPARAARLTGETAKEVIAQVGNLDEAHWAKDIEKYGGHLPIKIVRMNMGMATISENRSDTWGYRVFCADEDLKLRRFLMELFDWTKVSDNLGSIDEAKLMSNHEYLAKLEEKYANRPAPEVEDEDTVKRTLMYWNIKEGTTEEALGAAVKKALEDGHKWEDGAIINVMVKEKRNGQGLYGRIVFRDTGMATHAFFQQESPAIQGMKDGKGMRGVRVEQCEQVTAFEHGAS